MIKQLEIILSPDKLNDKAGLSSTAAKILKISPEENFSRYC